MCALRYFLPLAFCLLCFGVQAQDLHFSQFYHNPLQLNPARTGVFKGDWRASGLYRSQWTSVPVSYQTVSGTFEWKALRRKANALSLGLQLQNDRAGDAALRWTELGGTFALTHAFDKTMALGVGFGMKFVQNAFDPSLLKFKNQWDGEIFNANLPTKENFSRSSGVFSTLSAGLNLHVEPTGSRTRLDVGAGAFHLNRPGVGFRQDKQQTLSMRFAFLADGCLQRSEQFDWVAYVGIQGMSKATSIMAGGGIRRFLSTKPGKSTAVQATLGLRIGDAIIPAVQLEYNA